VEEKMASPDDPKVCKIGYVTGVLSSGFIYGDRFDTMNKCCDTFSEWFSVTGDRKYSGFSFRHMVDLEVRDGLCFGSYHGKTTLTVRIRGYEEEVKFCPFCGAKIVIENTKRIRLKERTKTIPDGYDEAAVIVD
jgi:hypothetical protein